MKCTAYKVMVPEWDNAYLLKSRGRYIPVWLLFLDKDQSLLELPWLRFEPTTFRTQIKQFMYIHAYNTQHDIYIVNNRQTVSQISETARFLWI